jgi:glycosyltransferase involved in cell wall biosynthesis
VKIAYECSSLLITPHTGVGNYLQLLLTHLLEIDHENSYWLFAHRRLKQQLWPSNNGNASWVTQSFPSRLLWMQCVLPFALRALHPTVVHFPNFVAPLIGEENFVVTVHDVGLLENPNLYSPRQRIVMRPFIAPTARRARFIIAMSRASKEEIVRILGVSPSRVRVVHEAAAPIFHQRVDTVECASRLSAYGWESRKPRGAKNGERHLLYVGTIEPRKNLEKLVHALMFIRRRGVSAHLWIVGQAGWQAAQLTRLVHELALENFVHLPGYIPITDLRAFYQACDVFVLASLLEGFGLPTIEAMACGAPIAVSDMEIMHEIVGNAGLFFDPMTEEEIAESIFTILSDDTLAQDLRERARVRARQFSWAHAARETLQVFREATCAPLVSA